MNSLELKAIGLGVVSGVIMSILILSAFPELLPYDFAVGFGTGMLCTQAWLMALRN